MFSKWDRMKENCLNNPALTPSIEKYLEGFEKGVRWGTKKKSRSP